MKNFILSSLDNIEIMGYEWDIQEPQQVLCIIHGIGEHAGRYDRMAKILNEEGIAVFSMDLRGHGKTEGVRGHCAPRKEVLLDVDELLLHASDKHKECPIFLYGHSMGGNIVLDYRNRGNLNSQIDGYVVSAPWVKLCKKVSGFLYRTIKLISKIFPTLKISASIDKNDLATGSAMDDYEKDTLVHNNISALCALEGFNIGNALYEDTHKVKGGGRKKPLLLMHGDRDKICSVEGSRKIKEIQSETCKYMEWEGLLHEIHNGNENMTGEEVIFQIAKWLKETK